MTLLELRDYSLVYVASPYSNYPHGLPAACEHVCKLAAHLIDCNITVYSPIAHSHTIAFQGGIDPLCHFTWLRLDRAMIKVCDVLLIAKLNGWRDSLGIKKETEWFREAGKPVFYIDPDSMEVT